MGANFKTLLFLHYMVYLCNQLISQFCFRSRKDALDAVKGGKGGRGDKDRNTSKVSVL